MGNLNGSHYYCSIGGLNWTSAQAVCQSYGGNLAVINSEAENQFLASVIPLSSAWIGCSDLASEGNFQWVNGDPLTYTNWYAGQPNNYNNSQHCVELLDDGQWNDQYPSLGLEYIMEISNCITYTQTAGPTPGAIVTPGTHTVSYTVQDGCGNIETCSFNITVTGPATTGNGYCTSGGASSNNSYINAAAFGQISNTSGNNGGYADFTSHCTTVAAGIHYPLQLTPGFGGASPVKVYWTVYIDYNMDGDFYDNYEFAAYGCGTKTLSGSIPIPYGVWNGTTRMRVIMKTGGYATDPCANYLHGETEDYCVTITGGDFDGDDEVTLRNNTSVEAIELLGQEEEQGLFAYPNPVNNILTLDVVGVDRLESIGLYNVEGRLIRSINTASYTNQIDATELNNGIYFIKANYTNGETLTERVIVQH